MPFYAVNEEVRVELEGVVVEGTLVDINIPKRQFKVETEDGSHWVSYTQIKPKES
jgi:hypothetical protein